MNYARVEAGRSARMRILEWMIAAEQLLVASACNARNARNSFQIADTSSALRFALQGASERCAVCLAYAKSTVAIQRKEKVIRFEGLK